VNFKEGESVQEGQLLARIDERGYQTALASAQSQLDRDLKELNLKSEPEKGAPAGRGDGEKRMAVERVNQDRKRIESLKNEITASKITAPISGVAGLRMVEAGNLVHPNDAIVVIAQLHPISVIANVPQDALSGLRAQLTAGKKPVVELWNRSNTVKLATGTFIATDNQIDQKTGMIKIKASFENKDDVLIPNQFVNVHVMPAANAAPASK
jgi:multidrug efflux system membrane fusion protein